ncbi:MAG TPA: acireductone synthase [Rudaea sp.]
MIRAILTDIEGTTSSISFVRDVLFPFARERLPAFIETHADKPVVQHWLREAAREAGLVSASQAEIVALLQRWVDEDRKATPLKALQGMIWEDGYREGAYRAHVYPEVAQRLRDWKARQIDLYVFSSGSVPAQKLLFRHSEAGDLTPLFSGYFDTEIGAKREAESYRRILAVMARPGAEVLFLSDIVAELDAARAAGMHTTLLARPPTACPVAGAHPCAPDFDAITPD